MKNYNDSVETNIDRQTLEKLIVKAIYRKSEKQRKVQKTREQATVKEAGRTGIPVAIGFE